MDSSQFDGFARSLAGSRRSLVSGILALAATGGALLTRTTGAKKKGRPNKKPKIGQPNEFGCLDVGQRCASAAQCCSSVCRGKKGKKTCRAHDTGTCQQGGAGHCIEQDPSRLSCNGSSDCACARTTAGSDACVANAPSGFDYCTGCVTDGDCEAVGYPAGSVCLPLHEGICAGACDSNRACFPPCGAAWPVS